MKLNREIIPLSGDGDPESALQMAMMKKVSKGSHIFASVFAIVIIDTMYSKIGSQKLKQN